jgi:hypothetical protein
MALEFNAPMNPRAPERMRNEPLRAEDNLSYLEFIALVKKLWEDGNPLVPFKPVQSQTYAFRAGNPSFDPALVESDTNIKDVDVDCMMVYSLELRRPNANEPKMRLREQIITDGDVNYIVQGQRFENIIIFSAISKGGPELAEAVIESFEDFMFEHTPVFKRLGISEILYSRRTPDDEQSRFSDDIDKRSVAYLVVTEKIQTTEVAKIEEIILNVRQFLSTNTVDGVCP